MVSVTQERIKIKIRESKMNNREAFIETYREELGCKNSGMCWCKICTLLEKIWDELREQFAEIIRNYGGK